MGDWYLEASIPYRDEHLVELRVQGRAGMFSGAASAYFGVDPDGLVPDVESFAAGLTAHPMPAEGGVELRSGFTEDPRESDFVTTVAVRPHGTGVRGHAYLHVELHSVHDRPGYRGSPGRVEFDLSVDPASLDRWSSSLKAVLTGEAEVAHIDGMPTEPR